MTSTSDGSVGACGDTAPTDAPDETAAALEWLLCALEGGNSWEVNAAHNHASALLARRRDGAA